MKDLRDCRVLVTPTTYGQQDPELRRTLEAEVGEVIYNTAGRRLTSAEVARLVPGCDGYIAGLDEIDRPVFEAADRLKVIARYGVGVDNIDLQAARERGVVVTCTRGANTASVAELTVALLLLLARPIQAASAAARAGEWPRPHGLTLEGKVIGLVGLGAIGQRVARILAGFGCVVLAHDPAPDTAAAQSLGVTLAPLMDVVKEADFLSLHCPLLPETRGLVGEELLRRMKRGAYLVNTARGELVDEAALAAALKAGHLAGAALDVFAEEPPGEGHPLVGLPQVIPTPHMASLTDGAVRAMGWGSLRDCLAVLRGEPPAEPVV